MKDKEEIKDKQIEEMAKVMNGYICKDRPCKECNYYGDTKILEPYCDYYLKARELVKQGYQKIDKNRVVFLRKDYVDTLQESKKQAYEFGCKEIAEKFLQLAYDRCLEKSFIKKVEELAKQFGVEIKDNEN
jgi:hypothetical protein